MDAEAAVSLELLLIDADSNLGVKREVTSCPPTRTLK